MKPSFADILFNLFLIAITGGIWLLVLIVKFLLKNTK